MIAAVLALLGIIIGSTQLFDNSFFTHLATGRLILAGHFPHSDPYTFTAHGRHWVVQSWLISVLYGVADKLWQGNGIQLLVAATTVALMLVIWRLARPARSVIGRCLALAGPLVIAGTAWGSRPLLFGLLFFAVLVLWVREAHDPRWLVPLMWLWVNSHGSFPLGLVYLGLVIVGGHLDGDDVRGELRMLAWAVGGTLLGALSPAGPEVLWFPVELLGKQKVLSTLLEWQAPQFRALWERAFLLEVMAAVALIPRLRGKNRYRATLPLTVFVAAALLGTRNIVIASVVLVPILAEELRDVGSVRTSVRSRANTIAIGAISVLCVALLAIRLSGPAYNFNAYPVKSVDWLQSQGLLVPGDRIAARDFVGNYLELRTRGRQPVFIDDRVDMFPQAVDEAFDTLIAGGPGWQSILDRYRIDTVIWERERPLASLLDESPKWKVVHRDGGWIVWRRAKPST